MGTTRPKRTRKTILIVSVYYLYGVQVTVGRTTFPEGHSGVLKGWLSSVRLSDRTRNREPFRLDDVLDKDSSRLSKRGNGYDFLDPTVIPFKVCAEDWNEGPRTLSSCSLLVSYFHTRSDLRSGVNTCFRRLGSDLARHVFTPLSLRSFS